MKHTLKIVGTVAVVGALAALAVVSMTPKTEAESTFLQSNADGEVVKAFNKFVSKHRKHYITRAEYNARLSQFRQTYDFVKNHDA